MLKIRMFRPFPKEEVINTLKNASKIAIIDRNISFGFGGIFSQEVKSSISCTKNASPIFEFITGLGGFDVTPELIEKIIDYTFTHSVPKKDIIWMGVKD
jgi:pyruvate/2-oxoacid:ferredoxin oxidoreductase alpha subunit